MKLSFRSAMIVLLAALSAPAVHAAPDAGASTRTRIDQILAQRDRVREVDAVGLSYDGRHLAWIVSQHEQTRLELAAASGQDAHAIAIPGDCAVKDLRWARHSARLAILTRCKVEPANTKPIRGAVWLLDAQAGKPPRKLADLDGYADGLQWSADDRRIAFLYVAGATRLPAATASGNPRVGVIGEDEAQLEQVAAIPADGGKPRLLTPHGLYVYEFRWSPIGGRLAYVAAPPPGDDNWWTAKLYVQDADAGATPKLIVDPAKVQGPLHGMQI
ncbi:MAG TPA: S9 family peptidase, partial [Rhodanobacteraceae bacterium]|nr:S9 family peptidase [Rhodanobacteraceae bacterium]